MQQGHTERCSYLKSSSVLSLAVCAYAGPAEVAVLLEVPGRVPEVAWQAASNRYRDFLGSMERLDVEIC